jgi:hypothetical protein
LSLAGYSPHARWPERATSILSHIARPGSVEGKEGGRGAPDDLDSTAPGSPGRNAREEPSMKTVIVARARADILPVEATAL